MFNINHRMEIKFYGKYSREDAKISKTQREVRIFAILHILLSVFAFSASLRDEFRMKVLTKIEFPDSSVSSVVKKMGDK